MTHFSHPRELTNIALEAVSKLRKAGAVMANQTPLLRGINDNPQVLAELFRRLSFAGIPPYYVFQCRPASGNYPYAVPIEEGYKIFESARSLVSGLAKRARFVMSHSTGKIEVVGETDVFVYFKYHRAAEDLDTGKFMSLRRNPGACWFDDYQEMINQDDLITPASA
jgi:L-lysine 2,3-aminomutase